jgi:hypothetical protein
VAAADREVEAAVGRNRGAGALGHEYRAGPGYRSGIG